MTTPRITKALGVLAPLVISLTACDTNTASTAIELPAAAAEGRSIANARGCGACHGTSGQGGIGPAFQGLFGSSIELDDGTTIIADRDYLIESIKEPGARKVAGYRLPMPTNRLSDEEIDQILIYIETLAIEAPDTPPESGTP